MHLNERLAEYVYEELTTAEMAEARRHVAECRDCQTRVAEFEQVHHALKAMPDEDLPRRVVIAPAVRRAPRVFLPVRWLVPIGATAALVLALVLVGPIHAEWHDSQFTIAFGKLPVAPAVQPTPSPVVQAVDYQRIVEEVRAQVRAQVVAGEIARLEKLSAENRAELRQAKDKIDFVWRQTLDQGSAIQTIAMKSED